MKVAVVAPDNRDEWGRYADTYPQFGPPITALLKGLADQPEIELHILSCTKQSMRAPQKLAGNTWFHLLHVKQWGWLRSIYSGCVRAIRNKLQEIQPDIVHGQGTERYCGLAAALSGFPNVITIHGNMLGMARTTHARPGSFYWAASILETFALRRTDGVFCNSKYTEELVRPRAKGVWNVPNALREIFFQPLPSRPRANKTALLSVGTIAPHKRQIEILRVARRLFDAGHRFHLKFVGGHNPSHSYAKQFIKLMSMAEQDGFVSYLSAESDADLLRLFDEADALVHFPSEEAFGLVAAEALARNLKLFGARTGGIPDIAANVEMVELYDTNDWTCLFDGLAHWMESGSNRPESAAHEMARKYHPSIIANRHITIYRDIVGRPKNGTKPREKMF